MISKKLQRKISKINRSFPRKGLLKYCRLAVEFGDIDWFYNERNLGWFKRMNVDVSSYIKELGREGIIYVKEDN